VNFELARINFVIIMVNWWKFFQARNGGMLRSSQTLTITCCPRCSVRWCSPTVLDPSTGSCPGKTRVPSPGGGPETATTATSNEGCGEGELATPRQMTSAARHSAVVAWGIVHTRLYLRCFWVIKLLIVRLTTNIMTDSNEKICVVS
jgi:hypothetical protein